MDMSRGSCSNAVGCSRIRRQPFLPHPLPIFFSKKWKEKTPSPSHPTNPSAPDPPHALPLVSHITTATQFPSLLRPGAVVINQSPEQATSLPRRQGASTNQGRRRLPRAGSDTRTSSRERASSLYSFSGDDLPLRARVPAAGFSFRLLRVAELWRKTHGRGATTAANDHRRWLLRVWSVPPCSCTPPASSSLPSLTSQPRAGSQAGRQVRMHQFRSPTRSGDVEEVDGVRFAHHPLLLRCPAHVGKCIILSSPSRLLHRLWRACAHQPEHGWQMDDDFHVFWLG